MKIEAVEAFALALPDVAGGSTWGNRAWTVGGHVFAWERALRKADLARFGDAPPPTSPILAVHVADLDAKDALLAIGLPGFFTIPHFNGYPAVLVELTKARVRDVKAVVRDAHRVMAARPVKKPRPKQPKRKR